MHTPVTLAMSNAYTTNAGGDRAAGGSRVLCAAHHGSWRQLRQSDREHPHPRPRPAAGD